MDAVLSRAITTLAPLFSDDKVDADDRWPQWLVLHLFEREAAGEVGVFRATMTPPMCKHMGVSKHEAREIAQVLETPGTRALLLQNTLQREVIDPSIGRMGHVSPRQFDLPGIRPGAVLNPEGEGFDILVQSTRMEDDHEEPMFALRFRWLPSRSTKPFSEELRACLMLENGEASHGGLMFEGVPYRHLPASLPVFPIYAWECRGDGGLSVTCVPPADEFEAFVFVKRGQYEDLEGFPLSMFLGWTCADLAITLRNQLRDFVGTPFNGRRPYTLADFQTCRLFFNVFGVCPTETDVASSATLLEILTRTNPLQHQFLDAPPFRWGHPVPVSTRAKIFVWLELADDRADSVLNLVGCEVALRSRSPPVPPGDAFEFGDVDARTSPLDFASFLTKADEEAELAYESSVRQQALPTGLALPAWWTHGSVPGPALLPYVPGASVVPPTGFVPRTQGAPRVAVARRRAQKRDAGADRTEEENAYLAATGKQVRYGGTAGRTRVPGSRPTQKRTQKMKKKKTAATRRPRRVGKK